MRSEPRILNIKVPFDTADPLNAWLAMAYYDKRNKYMFSSIIVSL